MADNKENKNIDLKNIRSINQNTQIVFTLKGFITIILTILGIFIGFYKMVIAPAIDDQKKQIEKIDAKTEEKFEKINNQLIEINNGLGIISGSIEGINNRFKDFNTIHKDESGSFK